MPAFSYRAVDPKGRNRSGALDAPSAAAARQTLRARGLLPLDVSESGRRASVKGVGGVKRRWAQRGLSLRALAQVTRQLATLLSAGLRIDEALATVARAQDARGAALLLALRAEVQEGRSFADALRGVPHVFPDIYRASARAGEQAGQLGRIMGLLADHIEGSAANRQTVALALLYPALLAIVSLTIIVMLMVFVVPDIVRVFATRGGDLPFLTRALIAISGTLVEFGLLLLGFLTAGLLIGRQILASDRYRFALDRLLSQSAVTRRLTREINAAQVAVTLATLLKSGVPLSDALATSEEVVSNRYIQRRVREIATRVRQGSALGVSMEEADVFPPMMVAMVSAGESSGNLADAFDRAATEQRRSLDAFIRTAVGLVEPLILLLMGGLVMLMVLAILLPILSLNTLATGP